MKIILIFLYLSFVLNSLVTAKSVLKIPKTNTIMKPSQTQVQTKASIPLPESVKLLIGVGGIYGAFLYYGTLQEDVFHYKAADGTMFKAAWFLQFLGIKSIYFYTY